MDSIGWFIATLHQMIGHDKAALVCGQVATADHADCLLCQYEREPTAANKQRVVEALKP